LLTISLGFAFERTKPTESPAQCSWIWADCRVRNWRGAGPCGWARFQFLPIRTAHEVFPQAAHPTRFFGRVMCRRGHGGHFHA
jgi:hypothetical protein